MNTTSSPDTPEAPDFWPEWRYEIGSIGRIAAYVSPRSILDDDQLRPRGSVDQRYQTGEHHSTLRRRLALEQYQRLADLEIRYDREPFTAGGRQPIRYPQWVLQESGTCLDLALLFAAMCQANRVAAYIALASQLDPEGKVSGPGHAFVVVDLNRDLSWSSFRPKPFDSAETVEPGVHRFTTDRAELTQLVDEGTLLAGDVTKATVPRSQSWSRAVEDGMAWIRGADPERVNNRLDLVDIVTLHADEDAPVHPLLPPKFQQAIRRYAPPAARKFHDYPSRRRVLERLDTGGPTGRIALIGDQGVGKSRLAREVLGGKGWFLNASSTENLIRELATAELREIGQLDHLAGDLELSDAKAYADKALVRLNSADSSWRVVLDNANGSPADIASLVPEPDRDKRQSVIVTSTNPDWAKATGFEPEWLQPLKKDDLPGELGTESELVKLIGGRALLVDAFLRLMEATGWTPRDLVSRMDGAIEATSAPAEFDGPRALWHVLSRIKSFDADDREVAYLLSWLPADEIRPELLNQVYPKGIAAARHLVRWGLVSELPDESRFAVHRLFGTVLRSEQKGPEADERVIELLQDEKVVDALGERGEQETLDLLIEKVKQADDESGASRPLGRALAGLGSMQELHGGVGVSAGLFKRALRHLDPDDSADRSLVATCLHGRSRDVNQHHGRDEPLVREALGWIEQSIALRLQEGDVVGAARGRAMEGLLIQKTAHFTDSAEGQLQIYLSAKETIDQSYEDRREVASEAEVARAQFNKGGVRVNLAQLDRADRARDHLDEAESAYGEVLTVRRSLYARTVHPHIAACISGLARVGYYRAIQLVDANHARRVAWLREATGYATQALSDWQVLDGDEDRNEVAKSGALLAKIALARQAFAVSISNNPNFDRTVRNGLRTFEKEIERAAIFPDGL